MNVFWLSLAISLAVLAAAVPLGGSILFGYAVVTLLIPHLLIGDVFHWSHFSRLTRSAKLTWLSLATLGVLIFLCIRQAGPYSLPLFYVYFFGHFWKDVHLGFGELATVASRAEGLRPKRWCGALLLIAFAVLSCGLLQDPAVLAIAKQIAWTTAGILVAWVLIPLVTGGASRDPVGRVWSRYAILTACWLLVFTWLDARHPDRSVVPHFMILWHFMLWYVFYVGMVWRSRSSLPAEPRHGLDWVRSSLVGLTVCIVIVNVVVAVGAWAYGTMAQFQWLKYVYNFQYLIGCWTVMHVTWDWVPKQIKDVRLSVV